MQGGEGFFASIARIRYATLLSLCAAGLLILVVLALAIGRYPLSLHDFSRYIAGDEVDANVRSVILQIRGPRVLAALLVGAALAAAGSVYQGILRNPLVSPDILGVSSGAALGAVAAMLLSANPFALQACAFAGGIAAVALVYAVGSRVRGQDPLVSLVLVGVVLGTLLASCVALFKLLADPLGQLPAITFWLLGSLALASAQDLAVAAPLVLLGLVPLVLLRWRIDLATLSDDEARAVGVDPRRLRAMLIAAATLITAAAVAISGIIGWIGLVVPHAARLMAGPAFARLLPLAMLLGAAFLLAVDTLCRSLGQVEVPPGVLTALIGTPVFLWLFATSRRGW